MISARRLIVPFAPAIVASALALACGSRAPEPQASTAPAPGADPHGAHQPSRPSSPPDSSRETPEINRTPAPGPAPAGMVWIPGGEFWMGCDDCDMPDARPMHLVSVGGFWMDATPVTNDQFAAFVKATGYVTVAERRPDPADFPGVPLDKLRPGAVVFTPPDHPVSLRDYTQWWSYVPGASWRRPEGPASDLKGRGRHPVVHVAWDDVDAYATWAGKRLPTEAEFEFAARGGLDRARYAWGNELKPGGKPVANVWDGRFPDTNTRDDGYFRTSPVTAFPANGYGLYDVGGNVWQWCADWYRPDYYSTFGDPGVPARDPRGPDSSFDPDEPGLRKRVTRGGSFLCSTDYCQRFLVGSRGKSEISTGASNLGFRLVRSASSR